MNRRRYVDHNWMSSAQRFKTVFMSSPVALWLQDISEIKSLKPPLPLSCLKKSKILEVNSSALSLFEAPNKKQFSKLLWTNAKVFWPAIKIFWAGEDFFEGEARVKTKKGYRYCLVRMSVPQRKEGTSPYLIVSMQDITHQKNSEIKLKRVVRLDSLTHLWNHRAIIERLEQEIIRAQRYKLDLTCFMIDIDHFKNINDFLGHQQGDLTLKRAARIIKECIRRSDTVGRYGGDEFLVILPETKELESKRAAVRIQNAMQERMLPASVASSIAHTVSIGISSFHLKKNKEAKHLIESADKAMYAAKQAGRNKIAFA